jgi:hypothetical protein
MALGTMGKIIMHKCQQTFNFSHQTQIIQSLDNHVCAMCHTMHTIHEWNMVLHQCCGDTIFEALQNYHSIWSCCNPSLGLTTKARVCKITGQEGRPRITSSVPGSVKECEGMNLHIPKWTPILRIGVPMDFQIFRGWLQG